MTSLPKTPGLATLAWSHDASVGSTTSPFTLQRKTYDYGSSRLRAVCTTPSMAKADAFLWMGFFARVRQTEEAILFGPRALQNAEFEGRAHRPGNPILRVNHDGGNVLQVKNLIETDDVTFPAGWFFSMENTDGKSDLYMIAETFTMTAGSGEEGEFKVFPHLRASYSVEKWLHFIDPHGQFNVVNYPTFSFTSDNLLAPITFELAQK